jgi:hypothetical protein
MVILIINFTSKQASKKANNQYFNYNNFRFKGIEVWFTAE